MRIQNQFNRVNYTANRLISNQSRREIAKDLFKPVETGDISVIRPYLHNNTDRTCDYTIGGIFMWTDYFDYEYCIIEDTLFIKGVSESHPERVAFSLPMGKLPLVDSARLILDYCNGKGLTPSFSAIPEFKARELAEICGGRMELLSGWSDYLYDAASLSTLQGKAYSKKRNHVNRFQTDNPNFRFEMIDDSNVGECIDFLDILDLSDKNDIVTADYELDQCRSVLSNFNVFAFEGALLRDNEGKICAFTLGEVIGDTLYVHIEKMNHSQAGSGETINKMFAEEIVGRYPRLLYINREEDMNDPGLRFAKESYHPCALLNKYDVMC